jgi:Fe-S cluster biosynthesis and repair protein YggX
MANRKDQDNFEGELEKLMFNEVAKKSWETQGAEFLKESTGNVRKMLDQGGGSLQLNHLYE